MQINSVGLVLCLITILIVGIEFAISPFCKKVLTSYYFYATVGMLLLIYIICGRYFDDWYAYFFVEDQNLLPSYAISKALLLDLCPFACFFLCLLLIVDPKRQIVKYIAPFAIFGGCITLFGEILFVVEDNYTIDAIWSWKWILFGTNPNEMYFMIHFIQVILGSLILINTKIVWKWSILFGFVFWFCYMSYILIIVNTCEVTENATGMVEYDWIEGQYSGVASFLPLPFPWIAIVGFSMVTVVIIGIISGFWGIQKLKPYKRIVEKEQEKLQTIQLKN